MSQPPSMTLHIDSFTFRVAATDLQSSAKRYTSNFGSRDGLTLLFAHCVGSRKFASAHAPRSIQAERHPLDKEQWEPTIEQIFRLQQRKDERYRIREVWAFDWQSHGDAAVINARVLDSRKDAVCQSKPRVSHPLEVLTSSWAAPAEWALSLESFVEAHLRGHRVVALGHSAGTGAILLSMKNFPVYKPPYIAVFLVEPTILSQQLFDAHAKEREDSANMTMKVTLTRRDSWPSKEAAAAYLQRRLPWKSWDSRVFDIYINHGLRTIPTPDGEAVGLKANKRQEGMAYPQFAPYIESFTLFRERCMIIPFHIIFGEKIDFM
ncbi:hypothetical protein C0995_007000 [Termitomyces sp. Mi166|nr:hypothetical protein C0995_007000 [Termitomyces sp. Mi166\